MKMMKLSKYFEIMHPTYVYLKLTPNYSLRNQSTDQIAKAICSLYRNLAQSIHRFEKKFFLEARSKVAYYIYVEPGKAEFYFIIPKTYLQLIKEKISNAWKGITITQVDQVPLFTQEANQYYLTYKKEDPLSLSVDKRTNTLLGSLLNVIPVLKEGDKLGIFYNFVPCSQMGWRAEYNKTLEKYKNNIPIDREKTDAFFIFKMLIVVVSYVLEMVENAFLSITRNPKESESMTDILFKKMNMIELSPSTLQKKELQVLDAQIVVFSESPDKTQSRNNARAVCTSFETITGDNELMIKKMKPIQFNPQQLYLPKADVIKVSTDECQNFLALPGRELLEEHNCIDKIDTFESEVPEDLQQGTICIGENTCRGINTKAYLTSDKEFKNLALILIGPTRAGKTTLISNISNDAVNAGECTVLFDFCGNCELSAEVSVKFPNSKVLTIDCQNQKTLQGLGYNEIKNNESNSFDLYRNAKIQTSQLLTLVNCVNADNKELSAKMDRYLESAAVVVFISGGPIKDVFGALQNHDIRHRYLHSIPASQQENLEEYIMSLQEIDEVDKKGFVIGTKTNLVAGIIDRINKLKQNPYMELMLKKDCSGNIDLTKEIQKSQLICLRMPEVMFSTETEKDIYCTYWMTKIWLALQIRKWEVPKEQHIKLNMIVDELYQVPHCQDFIRSKLSQMAKFSGKMIISCHYLGQIGIIRDELKAANSSYMLISGCDKDNHKELKDELYPYTVEDLLNLKRYHSLNLLKYEKGYAKFITKLPAPI